MIDSQEYIFEISVPLKNPKGLIYIIFFKVHIYKEGMHSNLEGLIKKRVSMHFTIL